MLEQIGYHPKRNPNGRKRGAVLNFYAIDVSQRCRYLGRIVLRCRNITARHWRNPGKPLPIIVTITPDTSAEAAFRGFDVERCGSPLRSV